MVAVSALVAAVTHRLVAADSLSDAAAILATGAALATILAAILLARRLPTSRSRLATPLALALVGATFVAASYADVMVDAQSLLHPADPDEGETIVALGPRGDDVRLSGEIVEGTARRLAALLDANPAVTRIALTSDGGLADEGEALRQVIAARGLTTYVPDFCVSACTLAFVGGRARLLMEGARLGFHAPFEEGLFGQTFAGDKTSTRAEYIEAGVDAAFVERALAKAPDDMWYPQSDQLVAAHVATRIVARDALPDSNLDADPTAKGARAVVLQNVPILAGLDTTAPALVRRIADWYLSRYREGWSEARVVDGLHVLSDSAVASAAAGADDHALVALARFLARAMAASDDEDDCRAIGGGGDLVAAVYAFGDDDPGAAATAAALVGATMKGPRVALAAPSPGLSLIASASRQRESCAALRRTYARALGRPVREAASLLRPRFAQWARSSSSGEGGDVTSVSPAPHS